MQLSNIFRTACAAMLILVVVGCEPELPTAAPPSLPDADLRILFIGNSLTYSNDLPGMVETVAEAAGLSIQTTSVASPGFSLEDHWNSGIRPVIRDLAADVVIMQQGPSSLPQNQTYLRDWTAVLADPIRESGGEPALLMVWPESSRAGAFGAVLQSYRNAATAVDGRFIPAGEAFRLAHEAEGLFPYGSDGFHPSPLGTTIVALSIVRTLFPDSLVDLPDPMVPTESENPTILLGENAEAILGIVETVVAELGI